MLPSPQEGVLSSYTNKFELQWDFYRKTHHKTIILPIVAPKKYWLSGYHLQRIHHYHKGHKNTHTD
jgi:hypothetical protein